MAKVLRITRHAASPAQLTELRRIYGSDLEVVEISETVDAKRVHELVGKHAPDAPEAVLPLPLVAELLNPRGGIAIPLIRAQMERELKENGEAVFHFSHYEKVVKVEIVTERL